MNKKIPFIDEGEMTSLIGNIADIINLIGVNFNNSARIYLLEHLVLSMRELSFYMNKYFQEKLNDDIREKMRIIKEIRDSICHRSSKNNWLNSVIKIHGALLFREEETEIQYGDNRIYLIKGIIDLYIKFREIYSDPLSNYKININEYRYNDEEVKISEWVSRIIELIKIQCTTYTS